MTDDRITDKAGLIPVERHTVRVLVIDSTERVLLFSSHGDAGEKFWFPPGGGVEPGETIEETARRELWEETGLREHEATLSATVARRRHIVPWDGVMTDFQETWLLARVNPFEIYTGGFSILERATITGHRWWTVAEIHESPERMVPVNLAELVEKLLRDGLPATPIELPV